MTEARIVDKDDESFDEEYKPKPFRATFGGMDLIQETLQGIATRDIDDGAQGIGRYAKTISIGRSLWETPSLSAAEAEEVHEPTFESTFPEEAQTYHKAAQAFIKQTEERPAPFEGKTEPFAHLSYKAYEARLDNWMAKVKLEVNAETGKPEPPTHEQLRVLEKVRDRLLVEFALNKEEPNEVPVAIHEQVYGANAAEPLRGLIHGLSGTGKSRVIKWIRRMFEEALGWEHGVHFICVAFQNRMAASIGGNTLHNAGDLPKPGENVEAKLSSSDIHNLYVKSHSLRWVLIDEISMIADDLLGLFESALDSAAVRSPHFYVRRDKSQVIMGGYNLLTFGDWWQLPPIPDSRFIYTSIRRQNEATRNCFEHVLGRWTRRSEFLSGAYDSEKS